MSLVLAALNTLKEPFWNFYIIAGENNLVAGKWKFDGRVRATGDQHIILVCAVRIPARDCDGVADAKTTFVRELPAIADLAMNKNRAIIHDLDGKAWVLEITARQASTHKGRELVNRPTFGGYETDQRQGDPSASIDFEFSGQISFFVDVNFQLVANPKAVLPAQASGSLSLKSRRRQGG